MLGGTRTNVVLKPEAEFFLFAPIMRPSRRGRPVVGLTINTALHTWQSRRGLEVRNSAAGTTFTNLTRSFVELFSIGTGWRGR